MRHQHSLRYLAPLFSAALLGALLLGCSRQASLDPSQVKVEKAPDPSVIEVQHPPPGYTLDWAGEYESQKRADERLAIIVPITILIITLIMHTMFRSFKWSALLLANLSMAPIGGLLALLISRTHFSVSSAFRYRPASSCWSTSTNSVRAAIPSRILRSRAPCAGCVRS